VGFSRVGIFREWFHAANVDTVYVFGLLFEQPAGQRGIIVQRRARVGLLARGYVYLVRFVFTRANEFRT
jgi:hypothetical protein